MIASGWKTMLAVAAGLVLAAAPAWACRGTHEYPDLALQLAQADLPAAEKAELQQQLEHGQALHEQGHQQDSKEIRLESLRILDAIKARLEQ